MPWAAAQIKPAVSASVLLSCWSVKPFHRETPTLKIPACFFLSYHAAMFTLRRDLTPYSWLETDRVILCLTEITTIKGNLDDPDLPSAVGSQSGSEDVYSHSCYLLMLIRPSGSRCLAFTTRTCSSRAAVEPRVRAAAGAQPRSRHLSAGASRDSA